MLQIAPDAEIEQETEASLGNEIFCVACGHVVTSTKWQANRGDNHEHVFFNPAGMVFRVVCFSEAPGVASHGMPSDEFTWFKGYDWQAVTCLGCNDHLGWQFTGTASGGADDVFFGLIKPKLTIQKPAAG